PSLLWYDEDHGLRGPMGDRPCPRKQKLFKESRHPAGMMLSSVPRLTHAACCSKPCRMLWNFRRRRRGSRTRIRRAAAGSGISSILRSRTSEILGPTSRTPTGRGARRVAEGVGATSSSEPGGSTMSFMFEVYYRPPTNPPKEAALTARVAGFGGRLTYREALNGSGMGGICLTYEFDDFQQ